MDRTRPAKPEGRSGMLERRWARVATQAAIAALLLAGAVLTGAALARLAEAIERALS
jgi:hypothetical protein